MSEPFVYPTPTGGSRPGGTTAGRTRPLRSRRVRSFRGRVEALEGRTLLTFGTGGIVTTQTVSGTTYGTQVLGLAIQPADQKIVAAGFNFASDPGPSPFVLVRYNTDGSLDSTFGSSGVVTTSFGRFNDDYAASVVVEPNGKLVAGGGNIYRKSSSAPVDLENFALARYNANGSLDKTFGKGGMVTTSFPASDGMVGINNLLLPSDGDIVAVGSTPFNSTDPLTVLAAYTPSGALDTTFGSGGTVVDSSLNSTSSTPNSLGGTTTVYEYFNPGGRDVSSPEPGSWIPAGSTLESDNSILVAGTYVTRTLVTDGTGSLVSSTTVQDLALVHYLANGSRDPSFGSNGIVMTPITPTGVTTSEAVGSGVLVQPNGAIVEVGTASGPNGYGDFLAARYNADGTADTTFGGGAGYTLIDLGAASVAGSVALQPNGQLVIAGLAATSTEGFATTRLNPDGSLDTTFGANGIVITQVTYSEFRFAGVGLETINGQTMILDAATARTGPPNAPQEIALVRYTPSGALDSGTTAAAKSLNFSAPASATTPTLAASTPGGWLAGRSWGRLATAIVGSPSISPSILPVAGLIPQALDGADPLDTMRPARRRR